MNEIETFVDAVFQRYEFFQDRLEEEQQLPSREVLINVCRVLRNVSTMREEHRYPVFRVCFIRPDSELLDAYLYAHVLLFEKPIPFREKELHRLAPALNADLSFLMLDVSGPEYTAVGILSAYTTWERIMTKEISTGNRMPQIPNLLIRAPGELEACLGESPLVRYRSGSCVFYRTDTFTKTPVAEVLRSGSHVSDEDRLRLLYRILWRMEDYGHGGHIYIVPSAESCSRYLAYKYRLSVPFLFGGSDASSGAEERFRAKDSITYADLIAKFTAVDGSIVLTKDLDLLGFGTETLVDKVNWESPSMCFIGYDDREDKTKRFDDNGMRHRACYHFCNQVEGAVAIIVSSDGIIKACTKIGEKVVVYDHIALPL